MSQWKEQRKAPVLPLYLAAAGVLVGALLLPVYTLPGLLGTLALGAAAYAAGRVLCPTRVCRVEVPYATGSEDTDALLAGIDANLDALHALNEQIADSALSRDMARMEKAGRAILQVVGQAPEKARSIDRFARYYLPEALRIMQVYAEMERNGVQGENAAAIQREVRENSATVATAFERQLDALYSSQALDLSTDIDVLESILRSQNLTP